MCCTFYILVERRFSDCNPYILIGEREKKIERAEIPLHRVFCVVRAEEEKPAHTHERERGEQRKDFWARFSTHTHSSPEREKKK